MGEVDAGPAVEGSVHLLLVQVLDHRLKNNDDNDEDNDNKS